MITRDEISKLSREEKWQVLELLQEALDDNEPEWLESLLGERRAELECGKVETFSLDEVEARYRARCG